MLSTGKNTDLANDITIVESFLEQFANFDKGKAYIATLCEQNQRKVKNLEEHCNLDKNNYFCLSLYAFDTRNSVAVLAEAVDQAEKEFAYVKKELDRIEAECSNQNQKEIVEAVRQHYICGVSICEIAEKMNVDRKTLKKRIKKILSNFVVPKNFIEKYEKILNCDYL